MATFECTKRKCQIKVVTDGIQVPSTITLPRVTISLSVKQSYHATSVFLSVQAKCRKLISQIKLKTSKSRYSVTFLEMRIATALIYTYFGTHITQNYACFVNKYKKNVNTICYCSSILSQISSSQTQQSVTCSVFSWSLTFRQQAYHKLPYMFRRSIITHVCLILASITLTKCECSYIPISSACYQT